MRPSQATSPAIAADDLVVRLGQRNVLRGVSLALAPGERVAVVGPNGAGKTTLLRALAGLIRPRRGQVSLPGGRGPAEPAARAGLGYLGHRPSLYPHLSARENLAFAARLHGVADGAARIEAALSTVGLASDANRLVRDYSRGMQQRLGLALALLPEPAVALLDEPDASLDAAGVNDLPMMLDALAPRATVLFSTHDERVARALGARIVRLEAGRISGATGTASSGAASDSAARARPPGFAHAVWAMIAKDARVEWRAREQVPTLLMFTLLAAVVFDMAFIAVLGSEVAAVAVGVLWISVLLAATLAGTRLFATEHERGTLDGLLVAPVDPSGIYLAKFALLALETAFVGIAQLVFLSLLLNVSLFQVSTIGAVVLAATAISAILALQSSLVVNARAREMLMPLLAIPPAVPVLLAGVGITLGALEVTPAGQQGAWFGLLAVIAVVFLTLGTVLYPQAART
ncbi:MAG: heme ABC exporter ATP-binding protein CcmA [Chloroflexota bacterium]|nr:heme ABC exporter ATP-binding protein CcmA [Chloroflexota bacterium]